MDVIDPIVTGIEPVSKLFCICIICSFDKDPIVKGKVPPIVL